MFKIGDKVRVKSDLEIGRGYNKCYFVSEMGDHRGKTGVITKVYKDDYQTRRYKLDIEEGYYFSNDMLDPINDSNSSLPYKVGDRVKIIDEMPENLYGISVHTWLQLLGKSGRIIEKHSTEDSYLIFIPELSIPFWFPPECFKKESTLTNENSIKNVSKPIECIPEIELSYCKKQIYTI